MEFERRSLKWYWVFLFMVYCGAVVYGLLSQNPYLYSHLRLRSELQKEPVSTVAPVPSEDAQPELPAKLTEQTFERRMNRERNGVGPIDRTFNEDFVEYEVHPLETQNLDLDLNKTKWALDSSGVYLTGTKSNAIAFALDGHRKWDFHFYDKDESPLQKIVIDNELAYLIHPDGKVAAVFKDSGQLKWTVNLDQPLGQTAWVTGHFLYVTVSTDPDEDGSAKASTQWALINRSNGTVKKYSAPIDAPSDFELSFAPDLKALILTFNNKVMAVAEDTLAPLWTQTLSDAVRGPVSVRGTDLYVSTAGAKIVRLDGSKKGKIAWEVTLERPAADAPTILPIMKKLSVMDDAGQLRVIDTKAGKSLWRYNVENQNILKSTWSNRLRGQLIPQNGMPWIHRGWTIWSPCAAKRFCIYNPAKGQLIARASLSGNLISLPFEQDKRLIFLIDMGKKGTPKWAVSQVLESSAARRLKSDKTDTNH